MCATTMTSQGVLPFLPEGLWLSGKLGSDSLADRNGVSDCSAGPHRSNVPRYQIETTPLTSHLNQLPAMPQRQEVLPLDPPRGLHSPLDELILWLNDTAAMYSGAYPQDAIGSESSPALHRPKIKAAVRYCAGHGNDDVPTIPAVDLHYHQCTFNKFQYFITYQGNANSNSSQGRTALQRAAERGAPAQDCSDQLPGRLEHPPVVHHLAKEDDVKQQRRVKRKRQIAARPRGLIRLAKKLSIMLSLALP